MAASLRKRCSGGHLCHVSQPGKPVTPKQPADFAGHHRVCFDVASRSTHGKSSDSRPASSDLPHLVLPKKTRKQLPAVCRIRILHKICVMVFSSPTVPLSCRLPSAVLRHSGVVQLAFPPRKAMCYVGGFMIAERAPTVNGLILGGLPDCRFRWRGCRRSD